VNSEPLATVPLATRLRLLRARLGLSQEQLARQLGVSFATVNRWEAGRSQPSASAILAIAKLEGQDAEQGSGELPLPQSSFVGRGRELAELAGLLTRSRLVTLTGPGGAGKTRLAIEAARHWDPEGSPGAGGAVFVPLGAVRAPQTAASAAASRLGLRDKPGLPVREALLTVLRGHPRLLVLDGAEHHRDEVAELAGELLAGAPGLRVLLTSRVVLGVPGEVCWAVPPLDCPSVAAGASDIASSDAVRLFVARASERLPGFSLADVAPHAVGELCRRLGGLPLAIELIAGWVGTLSIREIVQQRRALLDYEPSGSRGGRRLTDVLQASYDLLDTDQRRVLRMLSVFDEPVSVADAGAVMDLPAAEAAAAVRGLVDASWLLVIRGAEQNRFGMVETVRGFATERLENAGEAAEVRRRHAAHFAAMAKESERALVGAGAHDWTTRLEAAVSDLFTMLHWAADNGEVDLGLDASTSLWRWWLASGRLSAGRTWLSRFLAAAEEQPPGRGERTELTGRALSAAAALAAENGDYLEAERQARLALDIFEPRGDDERVAFAATVLGAAQRFLGKRADARVSFQTAMDLRAAAGDRRPLVAAMNNLALAEVDDGNLDRARELFEQALVIKRQLGDPRSIAIGLANLADALLRAGQLKAASMALREGADLAAGHPQVVGIILCNEGNLAAKQGNWKQAAARYEAAIEASGTGGHAHDVLEAMTGLGRACYRLGQEDEAARHLHAAEALANEIGHPRLLSDVKAALAEIAGGSSGHLPGDLTARQAEVLRLLADGLSNKEIASRLFLSPGTVERHLATIYHKLGLGGRVEAVRYAMENGLTEHTML
jgi:predicted ATPase/DNA-binding CsgD family transcriptional regulator/DNA-binding XRE family transcriptional regulator/Tfp pilus assembly protein PilF